MVRRMKHLIAIALSVAAAACGASSNPNPNTGAGKGSNMECHEETTPTSSVPREVCRPKGEAGDPNMPQNNTAPQAASPNH